MIFKYTVCCEITQWGRTCVTALQTTQKENCEKRCISFIYFLWLRSIFVLFLYGIVRDHNENLQTGTALQYWGSTRPELTTSRIWNANMNTRQTHGHYRINTSTCNAIQTHSRHLQRLTTWQNITYSCTTGQHHNLYGILWCTAVQNQLHSDCWKSSSVRKKRSVSKRKLGERATVSVVASRRALTWRRQGGRCEAHAQRAERTPPGFRWRRRRSCTWTGPGVRGSPCAWRTARRHGSRARSSDTRGTAATAVQRSTEYQLLPAWPTSVPVPRRPTVARGLGQTTDAPLGVEQWAPRHWRRRDHWRTVRQKVPAYRRLRLVQPCPVHPSSATGQRSPSSPGLRRRRPGRRRGCRCSACRRLPWTPFPCDVTASPPTERRKSGTGRIEVSSKFSPTDREAARNRRAQITTTRRVRRMGRSVVEFYASGEGCWRRRNSMAVDWAVAKRRRRRTLPTSDEYRAEHCDRQTFWTTRQLSIYPTTSSRRTLRAAFSVNRTPSRRAAEIGTTPSRVVAAVAVGTKVSKSPGTRAAGTVARRPSDHAARRYWAEVAAVPRTAGAVVVMSSWRRRVRGGQMPAIVASPAPTLPPRRLGARALTSSPNNVTSSCVAPTPRIRPRPFRTRRMRTETSPCVTLPSWTPPTALPEVTVTAVRWLRFAARRPETCRNRAGCVSPALHHRPSVASSPFRLDWRVTRGSWRRPAESRLQPWCRHPSSVPPRTSRRPTSSAFAEPLSCWLPSRPSPSTSWPSWCWWPSAGAGRSASPARTGPRRPRECCRPGWARSHDRVPFQAGDASARCWTWTRTGRRNSGTGAPSCATWGDWRASTTRRTGTDRSGSVSGASWDDCAGAAPGDGGTPSRRGTTPSDTPGCAPDECESAHGRRTVSVKHNTLTSWPICNF